MKRIFIAILCMFASSCAVTTIGYKQFYKQVAPSKYPETDEVRIFEYQNVDLIEIYDLLFSDYLIIGTSGFNGPYENPKRSISFAESIGADIFISTSQFKETRTSFVDMTTPSTQTTQVSGYTGSGTFYGTATTYGTRTTTIPVRVDRYDQDGIYLKNVNSIMPLWERTRELYLETADSVYTGLWKNERYQLNIIKSGKQIVAFIEEVIGGSSEWNQGDLKMIFGSESGVGIYMMGDRTPMPSRIALNKFGHLEVDLLTDSERPFSFEKDGIATGSSESNSIPQRVLDERSSVGNDVEYFPVHPMQVNEYSWFFNGSESDGYWRTKKVKTKNFDGFMQFSSSFKYGESVDWMPEDEVEIVDGTLGLGAYTLREDGLYTTHLKSEGDVHLLNTASLQKVISFPITPGAKEVVRYSEKVHVEFEIGRKRDEVPIQEGTVQDCWQIGKRIYINGKRAPRGKMSKSPDDPSEVIHICKGIGLVSKGTEHGAYDVLKSTKIFE